MSGGINPSQSFSFIVPPLGIRGLGEDFKQRSGRIGKKKIENMNLFYQFRMGREVGPCKVLIV